MLGLLKRYLHIIINKTNVSIRTKIIVIFVLATIIPLGSLGAISYVTYFNSMQETVSKNTSEIADQLNRNLELFFNNINKLLDIGNDDLIIHYLDETDPDKRYEYAKEIGARFGMYKGIYNFENIVLDVNIIGLKGNCISDRKGVYHYFGELKKNAIFLTTNEQPDKLNIIIGSNADSSSLSRISINADDIISVAKVVRRQLTKEVKGIILVEIDRNAIKDICSNIKLGDTGKFIVVDPDGNFIYHPGVIEQQNEGTIEKEILQNINGQEAGYFIKKINGEKYFAVYNTLQMPGWKIIGIVKLNEIMYSAYKINKWTIIIEVGLILAVILLFLLITNNMTIPIRELRNKMEMVESGDLNVEAKHKTNDEISDLSKGFNLMIIKIRELMEKDRIQQENLKKSEFKVLQAQINPHFLYNTLDAIVWTAEANNKEEVVNITKYLSNFFRVALSSGKEWILVKDETLHVDSYLSIQKVRYRDILEYTIEVDPEIMNLRILKLTLQPIVENALYHGLKNKRGGGSIKIIGRKLDDETLIFEVLDNGIGMLPHKLEALIREINKDEIDIDMKTGFGLKNINQRTKLYYGNKYGITIKSEHLNGTTVNVIIPIIRKKSDMNKIKSKKEDYHV